MFPQGVPSIPIPVDVWIDDQGRPRRVSQSLDLGQILGTDAARTLIGAAGLTGNESFTVDLFDYGKDVKVEAPPADKVVERPSSVNMGGLGGLKRGSA